MTIERGLRRIVLSLSLVAAGGAGWFGYDDGGDRWQLCHDIPAARREFPGKADVDALTLYHGRHLMGVYDADHKPRDLSVEIPELAKIQAREWAIDPCRGPVRQALIVGVWGLAAMGGVWALFFFAR